MSEEKKSTPIPRDVMVDRFVELANQFARTESKERVGAAIMFAAARYNAFEAKVKSKDIIKDRQEARAWYSAEYQKMWDANMDELVDL